MHVGAEFGFAYGLLTERNLNMNNEIKKGNTPVLGQVKSMPVILRPFSEYTQMYPGSSHDWLVYSVSIPSSWLSEEVRSHRPFCHVNIQTNLSLQLSF